MKVRFIIVGALALILVAGYFMQPPCTVALDHCWTGKETTVALNQLFHEDGPQPVKPLKRGVSAEGDDPFLQWLADINENRYGR